MIDRKRLEGLELELEFLREQVTVLKEALVAAKIEIPPTRSELSSMAEADARRMREAARRNE